MKPFANCSSCQTLNKKKIELLVKNLSLLINYQVWRGVNFKNSFWKKKKCNSPSPLPLHFYIMYISWFLIGVNGRCPLVRQLKMPKVKDTTQKKKKIRRKKSQTYRGEIASSWDTYISRCIFISYQGSELRVFFFKISSLPFSSRKMRKFFFFYR